jgi:hypothetical protein
MASETDDPAESPDEELQEILEETARERRWWGVKFIGAGLAAAALAWVVLWLGSPLGDLGGVERTIVKVLGYGGYFLGGLATLSGVALVINSLTLQH